MRFAAGLELSLLHIGTRLLGALVRLGFIRSLDNYAEKLFRLAFLFDRLGSGRSGFHIILTGTGRDGNPLKYRFVIVAVLGPRPLHSMHPGVLSARWLASGKALERGARPCVDLINLDTYLGGLKGLDISVIGDSANA